MLKPLTAKFATAVMRFSLKRLPEAKQHCRVEELSITVFHEANLPAEGIGIFLVEDGWPARNLFYWTDRATFLDAFSQIKDYGMSGADDSPFYSNLQCSDMSLNNQTLTYDRICQWLSGT